MEPNQGMHVVMLPWLAMGHLIPFFYLSKVLAQKGHKISFISTPRNLSKLPKLPPHLSSLITLVPFPLPRVPNLPAHVETTVDIPYSKQQTLKAAFDLLQPQVTDFLQRFKPDWVIYDYAPHWLPQIARELEVSSAYFCLFSATVMGFMGSPEILLGGGRSKAEDLTVVPKWVPFESNVAFRLHEITRHIKNAEEDESGPPDSVRFAVSIRDSEVVFIRTSPEFEPEWFSLLQELYGNIPVVPVGFLPPVLEEEKNENWVFVKEWLDKHRVGSVIYVSFGTEAELTRDELCELALGLEKSNLPFFWVLRNQSGAGQTGIESLPEGFVERVKGRGIVYDKWAPQVKTLSHDSVGGFLTHCGWNSVIEGLGCGRVLILFPVLNDQGLVSRCLHAKKLGAEVPRDRIDGSFSSDMVAQTIKLAMIDDAGDIFRENTKGMKSLFGNKDKNGEYENGFVRYLEEKKYIHTRDNVRNRRI